MLMEKASILLAALSRADVGQLLPSHPAFVLSHCSVASEASDAINNIYIYIYKYVYIYISLIVYQLRIRLRLFMLGKCSHSSRRSHAVTVKRLRICYKAILLLCSARDRLQVTRVIQGITYIYI